MEEAGISKIVAVRLARREQETGVGRDLIGTANASAAPGAIDESATGTVSGDDFTITHVPSVPRFDAEIGVTYEFMTFKSIEFTLGEQTITVGKKALFFRAKFVGIGDDESKIELVGDEGITVLYTGGLPTGHVLVRPIAESDETGATIDDRTE